jgi:hypothetical protein
MLNRAAIRATGQATNHATNKTNQKISLLLAGVLATPAYVAHFVFTKDFWFESRELP